MDHVTGSARDNQANAQDIDIMLDEGEVYSEDELISTQSPIFVRIKWNDQNLTDLPNGNDSQGICCVNGYKMKLAYCPDTKHLSSSLLWCFDVKHQTDIGQTSISRDPFINQSFLIDIGKQFGETLNTVIESSPSPQDRNYYYQLYNAIRQHVQQVFKKKQTKFAQVSRIDLFELPFMIWGSVYGLKMENMYRSQLSALIDFYHKYKQLSNGKIATQIINQMINRVISYATDIVVSIRLNFWPENVQPFLFRFKTAKPLLYEQIKTVYMHVVPKCAYNNTDIINQEYHFRYSFSVVEQVLANLRSPNEKQLYTLARNIYYKYLAGKTPTVKSYFIKTTVLWMCEKIDELSNDKLELTIQWITYASDKLKIHNCEHYFMNEINILEQCSIEDLNTAYEILMNIDTSSDHYEDNSLSKKSFHTIYAELINQGNEWACSLDPGIILQAVQNWAEMKIKYFSSSRKKAYSHLEECLFLLNCLAVLDGNENKNNLLLFKEHFLNEIDPTDVNETFWNNVNTFIPSAYVHGLLCLGYTSKWINDIVTNKDPIENVNKIHITLLTKIIDVVNQNHLFSIKTSFDGSIIDDNNSFSSSIAQILKVVTSAPLAYIKEIFTAKRSESTTTDSHYGELNDIDDNLKDENDMISIAIEQSLYENN